MSAIDREPAAPNTTLVLAATITASAMAFIDGSVVNIALPVIQRGLGASLADMQWVSNAYLLLLGSLILVGGGLGDRIGRRRIFLVGIVLFGAASLVCAVAPSVGVLIAARLAQGVGAALLVPQSLAIISATFPKEVRGAAIGTWAAASSIATSIGPPLGGFLIDLLSWRVAFWINVPISLLAIWLTARYVPENRDAGATGPIDWTGSAIAVLSLGALTYGLTAISGTGTSGAIIAITIAAGVVGLVAFVLYERRAANPVMPLELFRSPVFSGTNIVTVFLYGALAAFLFLMPFDLQARRGLTASETGLAMLPIGIIIGVFSRMTGGLADRYGPRLFLIVGPVLVGLGAAGLALNLANLWLGVIVPVLLISAGMAIVVSPLTTAVMNSVPDARSGAASGVNNAASRLAGVIAIAVIGAVASLVFTALAPAGSVFGILPAAGEAARGATEGAFLSAYSAAQGFSALWCFAAAFAAWLSLPPGGGTAEAK
jgi:EmrB/QacA subfamily drug resistance transporter